VANIFRPGYWLRALTAAPKAQTYDASASADSNVAEGRGPGAGPSTDAVERSQSLAERILLRAYRKWCEAGCPSGREVEFRALAERELLEEIHHGRPTPPAP
jgi:hypothetical protein